MKITDCWIECNDGHTVFMSLVSGIPLIGVHLDKWPIGEVDRQYRETIVPRYQGA